LLLSAGKGKAKEKLEYSKSVKGKSRRKVESEGCNLKSKERDVENKQI
jgi:hypothetical protein